MEKAAMPRSPAAYGFSQRHWINFPSFMEVFKLLSLESIEHNLRQDFRLNPMWNFLPAILACWMIVRLFWVCGKLFWRDSIDGEEESEVMDRNDDDMISTEDDFELKCSCGLPAKLRLSKTLRNPDRMFYNCPKEIGDQCGFFLWSDELELTDDRDIDELDRMCAGCNRLKMMLDEVWRLHDGVRLEHENQRRAWNSERSELISRLSELEAELDDIKRRVVMENESELMPPVYDLSSIDDEMDDMVNVHTIESSSP